MSTIRTWRIKMAGLLRATRIIKLTYATQAVAFMGAIAAAVLGSLEVRGENYVGAAIDAVCVLVNAAAFVVQIYVRHRLNGRAAKDHCPHCGARDWAPLLYGGEIPARVCRSCWRRG